MRDFLKKLQGLSDKKKKGIIIAVVIVLALILGSVWILSAKYRLDHTGNLLESLNLPNVELPADADKNLQKLGEAVSQADQEIKNADTANWKTYTNAEYGFEFSFPSDVIVNNQDKNTVMIADTTDGYTVNWSLRLYKNEDSKDLEDWAGAQFNQFKSPADKDCQIFTEGQSYNQGKVSIENSSNILITDTSDFNQSCNDAGYYVMSPDTKTVIKFLDIVQADPGHLQDIISTFKFTN